MKRPLAAMLIVCIASSSAFALGDIVIGPFLGMNMPLANEDAKSGTMFGIQARYSLLPVIALGAHFQARKFGDPSEQFFYGDDTKDGGKVNSFGLDAYLGKTGGTGVNFFFKGSIGTYKWKRETQEEISKTAYALGPGIELSLPVKVGIEGQAMMEIVPTGNQGSWKNFLWFVGVNYHFGLGPM